MGLILKIAAGVIIGLLVVQILMFQNVKVKHEEMKADIQQMQGLKNRLIVLTNSIHSYYRKNSKLPSFISDLQCVDVFNNRQKIDCASLMSDGVFYVNYKNNWAAAKPYVLDGKVFNQCQISIPFYGDDRYRDCLTLDVDSIPDKKTAQFDCNATSDEVEKIICSSDRLTEYDINLSSIYKSLLSKSLDEKKQQIKDDQINFIEQRRSKCRTSKCINTMTRNKITRLELLGVFKK